METTLFPAQTGNHNLSHTATDRVRDYLPISVQLSLLLHNKKRRVTALHFLFSLLYHVPCEEEIFHQWKIFIKEIVANRR